MGKGRRSQKQHLKVIGALLGKRAPCTNHTVCLYVCLSVCPQICYRVTLIDFVVKSLKIKVRGQASYMPTNLFPDYNSNLGRPVVFKLHIQCMYLSSLRKTRIDFEVEGTGNR